MSGLDEKGLEAASRRHDYWSGSGTTIGCLNARRNAEEIVSAYLAAATHADVGEEPVAPDIDWITTAHVFCDRLGIERKADAEHICTALGRVVRDRDNLQARLTARAKSMLRLREALAGVHDNIEDEGDRTYFGSTNDADTFCEVWQDLDAWAWDDIMSDGKMTDVYAASREAHTRAEVAEAKLAKARKVIEPFAEASIYHAAFGDERPVRADGDVKVKHLRAARRWIEETK